MDISTSITFDGMPPSEALREMILERARRLSRFADDIISCDVVVSVDERRHRHGNRYSVRARATLRDDVVEVGHTHEPDAGNEDPYVAANQAFDALRRRIEDHVRRRRGSVKTHADR